MMPLDVSCRRTGNVSCWRTGLFSRSGLVIFCLGVIAGLSAIPPTASAEGRRVLELRRAGSCELVPIESINFLNGRHDGLLLYIGGMRPYANMDIELRHQPGRRGMLTVRVVGCLNAVVGLPVQTHYNVDLPLKEFPRVSRLKIVGANGFVWRRVPKK